jgi:hypothetical protein
MGKAILVTEMAVQWQQYDRVKVHTIIRTS